MIIVSVYVGHALLSAFYAAGKLVCVPEAPERGFEVITTEPTTGTPGPFQHRAVAPMHEWSKFTSHFARRLDRLDILSLPCFNALAGQIWRRR